MLRLAGSEVYGGVAARMSVNCGRIDADRKYNVGRMRSER